MGDGRKTELSTKINVLKRDSRKTRTLYITTVAVPRCLGTLTLLTHGSRSLRSPASDDGQCSMIGTEIFARQGGSTVDAATATLLCLGVINPLHSCIGGVIYEIPI